MKKKAHLGLTMTFDQKLQIIKIKDQVNEALKMWNASRFCVSSLRRGHANLLCIVPILVYVLRE